MNSMKRQKDRKRKDELPKSVGARYATGDQWRNTSRKNEGMEPKKKQHPVVDVTGEEVKSSAVKNNIASRQIGSGQVGDGKSEHRHFRNQ